MRFKNKIKGLKGREILNSQGNPTLEVEIETEEGIFRASVPWGVSRGKNEAKEFPERRKKFFSKESKAEEIIEKIISPKLKGKKVFDQQKIDQILIDLDGTKDKSSLGANTILAVSIAVSRAGAATQNLPLYQYLRKIFNPQFEIESENFLFPNCCFNLIEGGLHAGGNLLFQEFLIIPQIKKTSFSFKENLKAACKIYHRLKEILKEKFGPQAINLGEEGGFTPPISKPREALNLLLESLKKVGYQKKVKLAIDCAASHFEDLKKRVKEVNFYLDLIKEYPILFLEDPFQEEEWEKWRKLRAEIKNSREKTLIIGDDLTVTNPRRIKIAYQKQACDGVIIKPNQIGTVSEAIEAAKKAKEFNFKIIVSHRSGETNDDFIADFALGIGADFFKGGAPARGERVAKYNRLLRIEN